MDIRTHAPSDLENIPDVIVVAKQSGVAIRELRYFDAIVCFSEKIATYFNAMCNSHFMN